MARLAGQAAPGGYICSKAPIMTDSNTTAPAARPTLLTVICILSFIMGAWGIFSGVKTMTQDSSAILEETRTAMEQAKADLGDQAEGIAGRMMDSAMEMAEKTAANAKNIGLTNIILSLVSLWGVWLMWNLKKNGFWYYLVAAIAGLVAPVVFLGGGLMAMASVGFSGFFTVLFVILYAVNLKYMH